MNLNGTDRITIVYNLFLFTFVFILKAKIGSYPYHIVFNLSVILLVIILSLHSKESSSIRILHLWYPVLLYGLLYYQTGLINRIIIPQFLDKFFLNLDVRIFGEFPGFLLHGTHGHTFFDEFFHASYFSYYVIIPMTGLLLYRKDESVFETYVFQLSFLFYLCFLIYVFLPVEGPIELRNEHYRQSGFFRTIVDFIYDKGENPGAAFPSSHVAATFLVAWWGSKHFPRAKVCYWSIFLFLSIATVYCMFHYAVDVFGGILLAVLLIGLYRLIPESRPVRA